MRYGNDLWCIGGELDGTSEVFHSAANTSELLQEGRPDLATRSEIRNAFRKPELNLTNIFSYFKSIFRNLKIQRKILISFDLLLL